MKNKINKTFLIAIVLIVFLSKCKSSKKGYTINGEIDNVQDQIKVYLKNNETMTIEDSTIINNNGYFHFKGVVEYPQKHSIIYKSKKGEKMHNLWIENTAIKITGTLNNLKDINILAGQEQKLSDEMYKKWSSFFYPKYNRLIKEKKYDSIHSLVNKAARVRLDFCIQNLNSYVAMESIYLNRNGISKDSLALILKDINSSILKSKYGQSLVLYSKSPDLKANESYIDFIAKTDKGVNIQISELLKNNKPILLIFGGLGCMGESGRKILKEFHKNYNDKIEILVFSSNKDEFYKGFKYDMDITLITDMKGDHSPIKIQYDIVATPTVFLINKEGIITLKSLGYGKNVNKEALKLLKT